MTAERPRRILVVANETVGGRALIDAVRAQAEQGPSAVRVICPQNTPRHGYVVYDGAVRAAAENRLRTTLAELREVGIEAEGEVMDPDPYTAIEDAVDTWGADQVILSTHPETRSGWMRRDIVQRVEEDLGVPVEHVVVDLDADRDEALRTLVVANQTVGGERLFDLLKEKNAERRRRFVLICPLSDDDTEATRARLESTLQRLREEGLDAVGQVMDPDPYTAIQNALQFYAVDDIVISTLPETRSGWLRTDLVERVRASTSRPVEHVTGEPDRAESRT